ncbi:hypothetical protein [Hymenobacter norwichensis]|uniref:hypothetical protein n=1 Tax=Hymenobacter norwichensis TaxID=223903 RepID=UPI0012FA5DDA|nr:hypothetical protein [Hymenobacter norwichensis]
MKLKDIIVSWDLALALVVGGLTYYYSPDRVFHDIALAFYNTGVSVLSILFSVYFAALAIILSSSSDEFVKFLEKDGSYSAIINLYKYTLAVLFVGLVTSISLSLVTSFKAKGPVNNQSQFYISTFAFLFSYAVFCSYNSARDAIAYSMYRMKFLKGK